MSTEIIFGTGGVSTLVARDKPAKIRLTAVV